MTAESKYIAHCTLLPIWIRGYDKEQGKYLYTLDKKEAYRFATEKEAKKAINNLGTAWAVHMEVEECRDASRSKTSRLIDTSHALNCAR